MARLCILQRAWFCVQPAVSLVPHSTASQRHTGDGALVFRRCGFTNWTTTALGCDDFYTDPNAIQLYKNYVRTVLTRVNSLTGVAYGADPTIMGAPPLWLLGFLKSPRHKP